MVAAEVETVILRFRDLVTQPGGTVKNHLDEISDHSYVWWGWWNKGGEKVPTEVFNELNSKAKQSALTIFLFDSGRKRVFRANCSEILWQHDLAEFKSPEPKATPAYYRRKQYSAWFKFTSIEEVDASVLTDWTYQRVDEFFKTNQSRYKPFYGKRVYSPDELQQQDRTIWFVRRFRKGDRSNEISLLDAFTFHPFDFPTEFTVSPNRHVLWLSDLHFSVDEHHGFPLQSTAAKHALWHAVESTLKKFKMDNLAAVLLSGDLTWKGDRKEFQHANEFIGELSTKLRLKNYDYLICPGNHDIVFSAQPWVDGQEVTEAPEEASAPYRELYETLFYIAPNEFMASGRRLICGRSIAVEIAALNSQILDQKKNMFQGHGFVGQNQLEFVASRMGWNEPQGGGFPLRVVMLHHHLLPVNFREIPEAGANYSVALDAEAVIRWIVEHRVKIVVHGHRHQPFYAKITRPTTPGAKDEHEFWILGLGSSGVAQKHLGEIAKNTMGVLTFSATAIEFRVFTIDPVNPPGEAWSVRIPL